MVAPLSDVPQEGSSVFSLFSLIKLHLASLPLASSYYSRVAVSSVFWAQYIFFSAETRVAPLSEAAVPKTLQNKIVNVALFSVVAKRSVADTYKASGLKNRLNGAPFSYRSRTPHLYEIFLLWFVIWLLRAYKYRQLRP